MLRTTALAAIISCSLLSSAGAPERAHAQDSVSRSSSSQDIVFHELYLSSEGVVGADTSGQVWQYDFGEAVFEKTTGLPSAGGVRPGTSGIREAEHLPVEVRCTDEILFKPFERKSITVGAEEYVDGDITVSGRVSVRGWVKGNVESFTGPVTIYETGQVNGDVRAPEITVRRGGVVLGRQIVTDKFQLPESLRTSIATAGLWVVFGLSLLFLVCAFLYVTLMPRQLEQFTQCIVRYPAKSAAVGLLFLVGLPVVLVLLAITLVGILVVPFVPIVYLFAITLGVVSCGRLVGRKMLHRAFDGQQPAMLESVVGLAALMAQWVLVTLLMGSSNSVTYGFGVFALVVAVIISAFPIVAGIGAALLTRFGYRAHISLRDRLAAEQAAVPAPAPPPIRRTTPFDVPPAAGTGASDVGPTQ
jgi:hypothetical protein